MFKYKIINNVLFIHKLVH